MMLENIDKLSCINQIENLQAQSPLYAENGRMLKVPGFIFSVL